MIRRRFGRKHGVLGKGEMNMNDCYAAAYYLYHMTEIALAADEGYDFTSGVRAFFRLCTKMNANEKLSVFLKKYVKKLERKGKLTPINREEVEEDSHRLGMAQFDGSDINYKYLEDRDVNRKLPSESIRVDENSINFFRCMIFVKDEELFLPRLIANFLLNKEPQDDFGLLEKIPPHVTKALRDTSHINFITSAIELTEDEANYLLFLYRIWNTPGIRAMYFNDLGEELRSEFRTRALGITPNIYNSILKANSALRAYGLLDDEGDLEEETNDCINAKNFDGFFADLLKEADCKDAYDLDSFNVKDNSVTIMKKILSSKENISILLYGKPGSGKTEFAKSLAKASGLKPMVFKNSAEITKNKNGEDNVLCRLYLLLSIERSDTVLIVDEADTLLKTRSMSFFGMKTPSASKGTVNKMLEESKNKIIWIVNFTDQIDESTLRRFNYSYRFEAMTREQLKMITASKIAPLGLKAEVSEQIIELMEKFSVTGASVDNVVKTIKSLDGSSSEELLDCVSAILKENSLLINGKPKMRETVVENYDTRALNASMDPDEIVRMVNNATKYAETCHTSANGIRMLFYGLSGTGKTEFARYIAEKLGKKILLCRCSDIIDKYVGETEKRIRDAFEEADRTDSILLFDEADSFFADRNGAEHSWERTQVNEFLTQMEEFSGILICTTNLKQIMDPAMNRRFHMIVEFKPLEQTGIKCMLEKYFASYKFTDDDVERLMRRSSVTPGDFGVLSNKIRFMDSDKLDGAYIVNELCKIQEEKNGGGSVRIGFHS